MDTNIQLTLRTIAHHKHQENRTDSTDYVEMFSSKRERRGLWFKGLRQRIQRNKRDTATFRPIIEPQNS